MISRRRFVEFVAACLVPGAQAQSPMQVYRIGVLRPTPVPPNDFMASALPNALRELGYVEGRNLILEMRYAEGKLDRLPALARDLVDKQMDVIVAVSAAAIRAAKAATSSIPIVFFGNLDPVKAGFVTSLGKPGGNVTGILIAPDGTLAAKKVELLVQAVPGTKRMAMLLPEDANTIREQLPEVRKAAAALGIEVLPFEVRSRDYRAAFEKIAQSRPESVFVAATTYFVFDRRQIIDLAARYRLPAIYEWPEQVEDGGLMSYGPEGLAAINRRIAACIDRILKGRINPADIPVEQPSKLSLVINLATAKAIGLAIPQPLRLRAERLIGE